MSCSVVHRRSSDLALLWLWCRPAAAAPTGPLAWEPPHAGGVALKRQKKKKLKKKEHQGIYLHIPKKSDSWGKLAKCFVYMTSGYLETSGTSKYFLLGLNAWHRKYLALTVCLMETNWAITALDSSSTSHVQ